MLQTASTGRRQNGELNMARKEAVVTFDTDRVTADMLILTTKAVFAGIAISVAMAVPVLLVAMS